MNTRERFYKPGARDEDQSRPKSRIPGTGRPDDGAAPDRGEERSLPEAVSLMALAESPADPAKTLLGNRYLCVGAGMLFIGPSGIGKSSASVQQDILWALGRPAFGIRPPRPLRILTIQAENDAGDVYEMARGVINRLELTKYDCEAIRDRVLYVSERVHVGGEFLSIVGRLLEKHRPDICGWTRFLPTWART